MGSGALRMFELWLESVQGLGSWYMPSSRASPHVSVRSSALLCGKLPPNVVGMH